jgi:predicted CoA-substrate-specific enzyme activase
MFCVGIDMGSRAVKTVLCDVDTRKIVDTGMADQGIHQDRIGMDLIGSMLDRNDVSWEELVAIQSTGYGRKLIRPEAIRHLTISGTQGSPSGDTVRFGAKTEITCHARGVRYFHPETRTIVDLGGQDSKIIEIDSEGFVENFVMNDRCAAGTGRFLEIVSARLGIPFESLESLLRKSRCPAEISNMCVVFAETEIVGLLASGALPEDVFAGVEKAIASRMASMVGPRVGEPIRFTGGGALVPGMAQALGEAFGKVVKVVDEPLHTGAVGAALLACEKVPDNVL